jgi:hypothetical protein
MTQWRGGWLRIAMLSRSSGRTTFRHGTTDGFAGHFLDQEWAAKFSQKQPHAK